MSRAITDKVKRIFTGLRASFGLGPHKEEVPVQGLRGEVFFDIRDAKSGEVLEQRRIQNVITKDMSILLARLCAGEDTKGVKALAVGSGDSDWDPQVPPQEEESQRSLENEITRKKFAEIKFVDGAGDDTLGVPTNVVEFVTIFDASEAAGPLMEMGLVGGDADDEIANPVDDNEEDVRGFDTLCNYLTFPVINKPSSATMTITWRLSF